MIDLNLELRDSVNNYDSLAIAKVFVSNIYKDDSKNVDTTLYQDISDTQTLIYINGDCAGFEGYLAVNHEIMEVMLSFYDSVTDMTICYVIRGRQKTKPYNHSKDAIIRSVALLRTSTSDSLDFSIKKQSEVAENNLFQPVLTNSSLTIYEEDTSKWVTYSGNNEYLVKQNKYVYIFIGYGEYCVRETTGYITEFFTSSKDKQITINFTSKLNLWYDKNIDYIKIYKNLDLRTFFSSLLGLPVEQVKYADYNTSSDFSNIEYVTLKDYDSYGDLIVEVCKSKNIRINFDSLENLIISTTVKKTNINDYVSTAQNLDIGIRNLTDIDSSIEKSMIFNNITCNFLKRKPLKNRNDFIIETSDWILADGTWNDLGLYRDDAVWYDTYADAVSGQGQLKYIRGFNSTATTANIISIDGSWKEFDVFVSTDVKYFQIGSQLIAQDLESGLEFVVLVTNKTEDTITCIGGFDKDKEIDYKGKIDYLATQGFNTPRQYAIHYNIIEMPYVWALNIDDKSDDLKIPILPNEELTYSAKYGTPELADIEFSGIVEENSQIFDTFDNSQLKYNSDFSQQLPIYLQTNKLKVEGNGQEQISKYSSFDNSNIELTVTQDETGENDFNVTLKNTMTSTFTTHTPLKTQLRVLTVGNIGNYNVGDVLVLDESNQGKSLYTDLQNEKWEVTSKFIDGATNYITVNKNYPTEEIGSTLTQHNYTFKKYPYNTIIHLNELRFRGNPVMEATEPYNSRNELSIENYGQKDFEISGDMATMEDMKLLFNSLKNEYSGLDSESTPMIIPFETTHRFDFEVGDLVRLSDSVITKLNNRIALIISKNYSTSNLLVFKYEAILISSYEPYAEDVQLSQVINYRPVSFATYDPIPNSDINTTGQETGNSIITVQSDNFGYITALRVERGSYRGLTKNNSSDAVDSIDITMEGELSSYNVPLLYSNKMCILQINNEHILVRGTQEIASNTQNTTVKVLERNLFGVSETVLGFNQDLVFYKILSIQSEDGNYFTDTVIGDKDLGYYMQWKNNRLTIQGELQIGGDRGRIYFKDSELILDDFFTSDGGNFLSRGVILQDANSILGRNSLLIISEQVENGISKDVFYNFNCKNYRLRMQLSPTTDAEMAIDSAVPGKDYALNIRDLKLSSSKNLIDKIFDGDGVVSYHDNHFWGYSDGWKQLDVDGTGTTYEKRILGFGMYLDLRLDTNKNVIQIFTEYSQVILPNLPDDRMNIKIVFTGSSENTRIETQDSSLIYEEGESPSLTKIISNKYECYSFINDGTNWYAMKINFSI